MQVLPNTVYIAVTLHITIFLHQASPQWKPFQSELSFFLFFTNWCKSLLKEYGHNKYYHKNWPNLKNLLLQMIFQCIEFSSKKSNSLNLIQITRVHYFQAISFVINATLEISAYSLDLPKNLSRRCLPALMKLQIIASW